MADITFEPVKGGIHAGGQHSQKNATGVRAIHTATGITVVIRGRSRQESIRKATKEIYTEIRRRNAAVKQKRQNSVRLHKIANTKIIRTYHYGRGTVKDHRTGLVASVKDVVGKGRIDLVAPLPVKGGRLAGNGVPIE